MKKRFRKILRLPRKQGLAVLSWEHESDGKEVKLDTDTEVVWLSTRNLLALDVAMMAGGSCAQACKRVRALVLAAGKRKPKGAK